MLGCFIVPVVTNEQSLAHCPLVTVCNHWYYETTKHRIDKQTTYSDSPSKNTPRELFRGVFFVCSVHSLKPFRTWPRLGLPHSFPLFDSNWCVCCLGDPGGVVCVSFYTTWDINTSKLPRLCSRNNYEKQKSKKKKITGQA